MLIQNTIFSSEDWSARLLAPIVPSNTGMDTENDK